MDQIINDFQALTVAQITPDGLQRLDNLIRNKKETLRNDFEDRKADVRTLIYATRASIVVVPAGGNAAHPGVEEGKWWYTTIAGLQNGEHQTIRSAVREHCDYNGNIYVRLYDGISFRVRWNTWHA